MAGCGRHEAITQKGSIGKIAEWANQPTGKICNTVVHCDDHICALKVRLCSAVVAYFTGR